MEEEKSERVLLGFALLMFALIIGYNAFFTPVIEPCVTSSVDIPVRSLNEGAVESSKEISEQSSTDANSKKSKVVQKSGRVNINTAPAQDLAKMLNGVGKATAAKIIEYREKNGGFSSIEEIKKVKGIGDKVFANIKDSITI